MSRSLPGSRGLLYMHVSSFAIFICAVVFVAWGAIWLRNRIWERRFRTRQAEWEALARNHSDLDHELDQIWYGR